MLILLAFSAFFSCSEAAFFSLSETDKQNLTRKGGLGEKALMLLKKPEYLLNSILFGNLIVNLLIFTISSVLTFQVGEKTNWAWLIALAALLAVILFGEVLPKNFGVTAPVFFTTASTPFLLLLVRVLRPVLPLLSKLNILSRRVLCPGIDPEPYLLSSDLERAVALSGEDAALLKREQRSLQNIVSLSAIQAEELMRPRSLLKVFKPPVTFDTVASELHGTLPKSGYCLLAEQDSEEIAAALCLSRLPAAATENFREKQFEPVIYVPWSVSAAEVFEQLQNAGRSVAVVINELGETIGIITVDDIIETVFTREQGRSRRLLDRLELQRVAQSVWQLTGLTSLRLLHRKFGVSFSAYSSLTVGGLLREVLERFPKAGDACRVENLEFKVVSVDEMNDLTVHLTVPAEPDIPLPR